MRRGGKVSAEHTDTRFPCFRTCDGRTSIQKKSAIRRSKQHRRNGDSRTLLRFYRCFGCVEAEGLLQWSTKANAFLASEPATDALRSRKHPPFAARSNTEGTANGTANRTAILEQFGGCVTAFEARTRKSFNSVIAVIPLQQ